jgi:lytic cellulose monooxygenase (C1-hydroxylating)
MKTLAILAGLVASASAHATWQQLWVNGVDQAGTCVRKPSSNSPVTSVSSDVCFLFSVTKMKDKILTV